MFKKKNNNQTKDQLVIDTSGLMDGRIEQIISLGFLNYQILVPKFVVLELQAVADKSDKIRRDRAREALNLTNELIKSNKAELINPDVEKDEVDNMLIATSLSLNANLQKVAEIEGVTVLNPNQLIHNIKLNFAPGEVIELKLSGKGTERDQAVGYVNGVMIVVKNGIRSLGKNVEVEITNLIEGENGHIVFAEIKKPSSNQTPARNNNFKKPASQPLQTRARTTERPVSRPSLKPAQKSDINKPKYPPRSPAKKDFRPKNNNQRKFVRRVSPEDKMLASIDQFGEDK